MIRKDGGCCVNFLFFFFCFATLLSEVNESRTWVIAFLSPPFLDLRLPLVLTFFASEDRVHKLQSPKLKDILDSVNCKPNSPMEDSTASSI